MRSYSLFFHLGRNDKKRRISSMSLQKIFLLIATATSCCCCNLLFFVSSIHDCHASTTSVAQLLSKNTHIRSAITYPNSILTRTTIIRGGGSTSTSSSSSSSFGQFGRVPPKRRKQFTSSSSQKQRSPFDDIVQDADQDPMPDEATAKEMMNAFLTRDSRNTFIARVYAILAGQLLVTGLSVLLFGTNPGWRQFIYAGSGKMVPIISLVISTVSFIIMCASADARRKSPQKWWLLSIFTLGEAVSVGFISSFYVFKSVLSAMLATTIATAAVSLYTGLQKKPQYDLSQWGATLSSVALTFLVYGIIGLLQTAGVIPANFLPYNDAMYSMIGATLFSAYLAYHTRLIVGGKHSKYQLNEKDYVFGAMTLYNDIINMFIYTLRVIGEDRDR